MHRNQKISSGGVISALQIFLNAIIIREGFVSNPQWYWLLIITIPVLIISIMLMPKASN
jgi:hypothetical protein